MSHFQQYLPVFDALYLQDSHQNQTETRRIPRYTIQLSINADKPYISRTVALISLICFTLRGAPKHL